MTAPERRRQLSSTAAHLLAAALGAAFVALVLAVYMLRVGVIG